MLALAEEHADTGRTIHFMSREGVEIRVKILHVYFKMGSSLRTVDEHRDTVGMGLGYDFFDRIDRAEDIGRMADGHEARMLVEKRAIDIHVKRSVLTDGDHAQFDVGMALEQLPRDYIGMVFHHGEDYFVTVAEECTAV